MGRLSQMGHLTVRPEDEIRQSKEFQPMVTTGALSMCRTCVTLRVTFRPQGIVITGPGRPLRVRGADPESEHSSTGKTFWSRRTQDKVRSLRRAKVLVIGAGDTAATIVLHLIDLARGSSY